MKASFNIDEISEIIEILENKLLKYDIILNKYESYYKIKEMTAEYHATKWYKKIFSRFPKKATTIYQYAFLCKFFNTVSKSQVILKYNGRTSSMEYDSAYMRYKPIERILKSLKDAEARMAYEFHLDEMELEYVEGF